MGVKREQATLGPSSPPSGGAEEALFALCSIKPNEVLEPAFAPTIDHGSSMTDKDSRRAAELLHLRHRNLAKGRAGEPAHQPRRACSTCPAIRRALRNMAASTIRPGRRRRNCSAIWKTHRPLPFHPAWGAIGSDGCSACSRPATGSSARRTAIIRHAFSPSAS